MAPLAANTSQRIVAGFVDVAPLFVVTVAIHVFVPPSDGAATTARIIAGLCLLLKDFTGASPGKWLVGARVTDRAGASAASGRRIARNATLAAAPLLMGVPVLGRLAAVLAIVEMILVLAQRERVGDRLAGTTVIRRAVLPEISAA
jgi:uncharacterized RDD family membrane protein YckC